MGDDDKVKIVMVESYPPEITSSLSLQSKSYTFAENILKTEGFVPFYEFHTGILTSTQRGFFEEMVSRAPKKIKVFLDPLIVSFAVRDACDLSGVEYVWLDLEKNDDVGSSAWIKKKDVEKLYQTTFHLIDSHIGKYLLDAYDRKTREDLERAWQAELRLPECQVCGATVIERKTPPLKVNGERLRGWSCSNCGFQTLLPSDELELVEARRVKNLERK
jgi:hypothetical protein